MLAVLIAAVVIHPTGYFFGTAERATGLPVACLAPTGWSEYATTWPESDLRNDDGVWDYRFRVIVMRQGLCNPLRNWRYAPRCDVAIGVFTLAHEYRHSQQHGGNAPYAQTDERDADRWAFRHFRGLARRLGVRRDLGNCVN